MSQLDVEITNLIGTATGSAQSYGRTEYKVIAELKSISAQENIGNDRAASKTWQEKPQSAIDQVDPQLRERHWAKSELHSGEK